MARPTFPPNTSVLRSRVNKYYNQKKNKIFLISLPLPIVTKLNVTALTYTRQIMSNQSPKPLLDVINKYHTEECKSCNI